MGVAKAMLRMKCIATNAYIKKEERSQIKLNPPPWETGGGWNQTKAKGSRS